MENVIINENERIDDLQFKNLKIIQDKNEFCFGIDSVILSDFAKEIKKDSKIIDLGTGTGIIAILLAAKTKAKKIIGVEIQEKMCEIAKRNVKLNYLENKIEIINEDLKNVSKILKRNSFDTVITNPPYKKINTGLINKNEGKIVSRHEIKCNLEDIIKASNYLLKDMGELYMIHKTERLVDICELLRKYKIEPKIMRFIHSKKGKEPKLILVKAIKNAKSFLKVDKPLFIYDENGNYSEEIIKIYNYEK